MGAARLELANTQYYGWAAKSRALLPTREQNETAEQVVRGSTRAISGQAGDRLRARHYFADRGLHGRMGPELPLHHAIGTALRATPRPQFRGLNFDSVRDSPLAEIWNSSPALNAFRGEDWMIEPCRSCPNRKTDFGGCRCQAFILTGDARAADPVCSLSPAHEIVTRAFDAPRDGHLVYRDATNSRRL